MSTYLPVTESEINLYTLMSSQGEKLRFLREKKGLSTRKMAKLSEGAFSHSYISNLEIGIANWSGVSLQALKGMARALNMTLDDFITEVDGRTVVHPVELPQRAIPLYDNVSAGKGLYDGKIIGEVLIPIEWQGEYTAYKVQGDSMKPVIPHDSIIIIKLQNHAHEQQTIVAYASEYGMVFKHFDRLTVDGFYILRSFNPAYDPLIRRWPKTLFFSFS